MILKRLGAALLLTATLAHASHMDDECMRVIQEGDALHLAFASAHQAREVAESLSDSLLSPLMEASDDPLQMTVRLPSLHETHMTWLAPCLKAKLQEAFEEEMVGRYWHGLVALFVYGNTFSDVADSTSWFSILSTWGKISELHLFQDLAWMAGLANTIKGVSQANSCTALTYASCADHMAFVSQPPANLSGSSGASGDGADRENLRQRLRELSVSRDHLEEDSEHSDSEDWGVDEAKKYQDDSRDDGAP